MGFRTGAWCTVWSVEPQSDTATKVRLSVSRKDKQTDQYVEDFSGFVMFYGTSAASKAAKLKERDRIKLGDVDCRSKYVPEKNTTYYNFNVYSFDTQEETSGASQSQSRGVAYGDTSFMDIPDGVTDEMLPF